MPPFIQNEQQLLLEVAELLLGLRQLAIGEMRELDRKSTRLNSSH